MKKTLLNAAVLLSLMLNEGCKEKRTLYSSQTLYSHRVLTYVELKPSMSLQFTRLWELPFWEIKSLSDGGFVSHIQSPQGSIKDCIYPGTLVFEDNDTRFRKYGTIYNQNQERYDQICRDLGDQIQERMCYYTVAHQSDYFIEHSPQCPGVYLGALFNRIDSLQIVCTNQTFAGVPPGASLNDKFIFSGTFLDFNTSEKCTYSDQSIKPVARPFSALLSEFHRQTGSAGLRYLTVADAKFLEYSAPCTYASGNKAPSIKLAKGVTVAPGTYLFKLTFYLDGGKLTVESNEIKETF